jgi:hypothetical protein
MTVLLPVLLVAGIFASQAASQTIFKFDGSGFLEFPIVGCHPFSLISSCQNAGASASRISFEFRTTQRLATLFHASSTAPLNYIDFINIEIRDGQLVHMLSLGDVPVATPIST